MDAKATALDCPRGSTRMDVCTSISSPESLELLELEAARSNIQLSFHTPGKRWRNGLTRRMFSSWLGSDKVEVRTAFAGGEMLDAWLVDVSMFVESLYCVVAKKSVRKPTMTVDVRSVLRRKGIVGQLGEWFSRDPWRRSLVFGSQFAKRRESRGLG